MRSTPTQRNAIVKKQQMHSGKRPSKLRFPKRRIQIRKLVFEMVQNVTYGEPYFVNKTQAQWKADLESLWNQLCTNVTNLTSHGRAYIRHALDSVTKTLCNMRRV